MMTIHTVYKTFLVNTENLQISKTKPFTANTMYYESNDACLNTRAKCLETLGFMETVSGTPPVSISRT